MNTSPRAVSGAALARPNLPTVAAIAVTVSALGALTHEGLGHGGAALLLGARGVTVGSAALGYDPASVGDAANRLIGAAGPLANVVVGLLALALMRATRGGNARYFLWLLGHVSLFAGAGYALALAYAPFGDWDQVTRGLGGEWLWRTLIFLAGLLISFWTLSSAARSALVFLPTHGSQRGALAVLTVVPYLLDGAVSTLIAALGTRDLTVTLLSAAAASFGGGVFILWVNFVVPRLRRRPVQTTALPITLSWPWLLTGLAALLFYALVLGPGAKV